MKPLSHCFTCWTQWMCHRWTINKQTPKLGLQSKTAREKPGEELKWVRPQFFCTQCFFVFPAIRNNLKLFCVHVRNFETNCFCCVECRGKNASRESTELEETGNLGLLWKVVLSKYFGKHFWWERWNEAQTFKLLLLPAAKQGQRGCGWKVWFP